MNREARNWKESSAGRRSTGDEPAVKISARLFGVAFLMLTMLIVPGALLAQVNVIMTVAGQGAAGVSLSLPVGVAADAAGNFYVADTTNCVIYKITNGISTVIAGTAGNCSPGSGVNPTLAYPVDVASCNGKVYFATHGVDPVLPAMTGKTLAGGSIYMVDSSGVISTLPTPTLPSMALSAPFPVALACDATGNVFVSSYFYISEGFEGSVDEIPVNSATSQNLIAQFGDAFPGIAVDSKDTVFVLEAQSFAGWLGVGSFGSGALWKLTGNNSSTVVNTSGLLENPARLALDSGGNFYITQSTAASNPTVLVTTVPLPGLAPPRQTRPPRPPAHPRHQRNLAMGRDVPDLLAAALRPASTRLTSTNNPSGTKGGAPRRGRSRCTPGHTGNPCTTQPRAKRT